LDILRCVSAVATKLSSWRCGNKLLKVVADHHGCREGPWRPQKF